MRVGISVGLLRLPFWVLVCIHLVNDPGLETLQIEAKKKGLEGPFSIVKRSIF